MSLATDGRHSTLLQVNKFVSEEANRLVKGESTEDLKVHNFV